MKNELITVLETICPGKVFLQGTLNENEAYPSDFITFWANYTDDRAHYDNTVHSVDWDFNVFFYSNDPDKVSSVPASIYTALKANGFIPQGKGHDIVSDVQTHSGWAMEFIKTEYINNLESGD